MDEQSFWTLSWLFLMTQSAFLHRAEWFGSISKLVILPPSCFLQLRLGNYPSQDSQSKSRVRSSKWYCTSVNIGAVLRGSVKPDETPSLYASASCSLFLWWAFTDNLPFLSPYDTEKQCSVKHLTKEEQWQFVLREDSLTLILAHGL